MVALDILFVYWSYLLITVFVFFPIYILIKYYLKTRIIEFLILTGVFLATAINKLAVTLWQILIENLPESGLSDQLFYQFIADLSYIIIFVQVFILALRIKWENPPKILLYGGFFWFFANILSLGYHFLSTLPETFILNILIFREVTRVLILGLTFYVYLTTSPVIFDERVISAKRFWLISIGLLIIYGLIHAFGIIITGDLSLYHEEFFLRSELSQLTIFTNLSGFIIITFVTIRYPEAMIFSKAHLLRAMDTYQAILSLKTEVDRKEYGMTTLVNFLQSIPPELIDQSLKTPN